VAVCDVGEVWGGAGATRGGGGEGSIWVEDGVYVVCEDAVAHSWLTD
jgi:hypothetical protein